MVRCKSKKSLVGKTAIITGANSGIGYETALEFAKRGCRVILACRNEQRANEACNKIISVTSNQNVIYKLLDLESLTSVREFVKDILANEERLDLLVNNAGAFMFPDKVTEDGIQLGMACNYFSHFLLTMLLLDLLKKSAPSRIINVSSYAAALVWNLNLDDLNKHGGFGMYSRSKLCQIYFTQELAQRLEGSNVTVYSYHPGAVHTNAQNFSTFISWFASKFFKSAEEGMQTGLYLALEDDIENYSGEHFENCQPISPYWSARDPDKRKKLWEISEKLVGLQQ